MVNQNRKDGFLVAAVFYGGLWGLTEATAGYVLHILPELAPLPHLSGVILFPVGLFFMIRAMRATGKPAAAAAAALVAASVKAVTVALPFIAFRFVRNPAIAILLEGSVVWMVLGAGEWKPGRRLILQAAVMSLGWRTLFLGVNIFLKLPGIANKPLELQRNFILIEGSIDALIIVLAAFIGQAVLKPAEDRAVRHRQTVGPLGAFTAFLTGVGFQVLSLSLP
jgi:hypothetical protein